MRRMVLLILFVASSSRCGAQTAAQPKKHLLVLGEEKGYRHEAVSTRSLPSSASAGNGIVDHDNPYKYRSAD